MCSGVVVLQRGGTPFRQVFLSRDGTRVNIVYHKRNTDTAAFRQISSGCDPPKCQSLSRISLKLLPPDFKTKVHEIRFPLGLRPRPRWGGACIASPDPTPYWPCLNPTAGFKGPTSKGDEGMEREEAKEGQVAHSGK